MKKETITRIKLTAAKGMAFTNGTTFGKEVSLGSGDSADNWTEITDAEAKKIQEERDAEAQTAV